MRWLTALVLAVMVTLASVAATVHAEVVAQYPAVGCWWCYVPNYWTCYTFSWCAWYGW